MVMRFVEVAMLVVLFATTTGCLGPRRSDYVVSHAVSIEDPSQQADEVWTAIEEALRRSRFRLDRTDRRAGVMTSFPETSQHFFDF